MDGLVVGYERNLHPDALLFAGGLIEDVDHIVERRIRLPAVNMPQRDRYGLLLRFFAARAGAESRQQAQQQTQAQKRRLGRGFLFIHCRHRPSLLQCVHHGHQEARARGAIDKLVDQSFLFCAAHLLCQLFFRVLVH